MKLVLGYPPSLNNLYATVRGRRVLSREGRRYKAAMAESAAVQGAKPLSGPVRVEVRVYRPRRAGDLDNTLKALLDALKGVTWEDDSQVAEIHATRHEDKEKPRVEVEINSVLADQAMATELEAARPRLVQAVRDELRALATPAVYRPGRPKP